MFFRIIYFKGKELILFSYRLSTFGISAYYAATENGIGDLGRVRATGETQVVRVRGLPQLTGLAPSEGVVFAELATRRTRELSGLLLTELDVRMLLLAVNNLFGISEIRGG